MPKATVIVSHFHNLAPGAIADELGTVKAQIADLETREKALRDELIRRGVSAIEGATYSATIIQSVRWTLDTKALKAERGQAWYDARCRQSLVTTFAVKALAAPAKLAA